MYSVTTTGRDDEVQKGLNRVRIVVVGAGVVGTAIAYRTAQAGARVMLVDDQDPASGTSGNSFAWLNASRKEPVEYFGLNARSIGDHRQLMDEVGGDWLGRHGGLHWVDSSNTAAVTRLKDQVHRMRRWGTLVHEYEPHEIPGLIEPDLKIDVARVGSVFHVPEEGWLNAPVMVRELIKTASIRYGLEFVPGKVTSLSGSNGAIGAVNLASGERLEADQVIICAGPATQEVAALAGVSIPMTPMSGELVVTAPSTVRLRNVITSPDVCLRPDGGGRILLTADQDADDAQLRGPKPSREELGRTLLERGDRLLPGLATTGIEQHRHGVLAMPEDGMPVVGPSEPSGLYIATTHSGITLSARIATLVVNDLLGVDVDELAAFRPARFV